MSFQTFKATIIGNRIEWEGGEGPLLDGSVRVMVTVLEPEEPAASELPNGPAMAAALAEISARGGPKNYGDPLEWQRDVRKDRPLPGREP
jgi:hypothetical protein